MDYKIYTENTLDSNDNDMRKLFSFDTNTSYRFRTLDQLNDLCSIINVSKFNLSSGLQYYLQTYRKLLDISRLCRALAVPGELAEQFIEAERPKHYIDGLEKISYMTKQISTILDNYKCDNNSLFKTDLTYKQKEAIYTDINELSIYLKMYYDVESVKLDPIISHEYPSGNCFDHILDIMRYGAVIIRFKYVSRNNVHPIEEKVVSYHIMDLVHDKNDYHEKVLGVHIEGDPKISMYKKWGEGDEKLRPIYPEYENTVIRWGRDEVHEYISLSHADKQDKEEFLY